MRKYNTEFIFGELLLFVNLTTVVSHQLNRWWPLSGLAAGTEERDVVWLPRLRFLWSRCA